MCSSGGTPTPSSVDWLCGFDCCDWQEQVRFPGACWSGLLFFWQDAKVSPPIPQTLRRNRVSCACQTFVLCRNSCGKQDETMVNPPRVHFVFGVCSAPHWNTDRSSNILNTRTNGEKILGINQSSFFMSWHTPVAKRRKRSNRTARPFILRSQGKYI